VSGPGQWWPRFEAKGDGRLTVAVARRWWVVGRRGSAQRGWPAVAGGRVLGRESVWRSGDARGCAGVAGGGPVRAGVVEALSGSGAAPVAPLRRLCFDDKVVGLGLEGGGGARGAAARALKALRYGLVDGD
jgi:hypothetical protein